jgi:hypothetical protein
MMKNVHSKHQYFDENLKTEREKINTLKEKLIQLKEDARNNINTNDIVCYKCWYSFYELNYNYLIFHVLENNKHIKKSYDDTLFPLQYLFILISYLNMISITIIFKRPIRLFLLSNVFASISLCIHGELFIADVPNVYYTLIVGICIFLFSIYVLLKSLIAILTVIHYRGIKNILKNELF